MTDGLKDAHREAIIAEIAASGCVERAVLFGSRATGTHTLSSDVDIALFGDQLTLTDHARLTAKLDKIPMAQSVDLILYDSIRNRTLQEHIRNEGVEWFAHSNSRHSNRATRPLAARHSVFLNKWATAPLNELIDLTLSSVDKKSKDHEIDVQLCNYMDVYNNCCIRSNMEFMWATATEREIARCSLAKGDVVITKDSEKHDDIGVPALIRDEVQNLVCGYHLAILRPRAGRVHGPYLVYALSTASTQRQFHSFANGVTRFGLRKHDIGLVEISLPPVTQQRAIAHILGTLDDKIELNRRMNETIEAMARALFKSWFVDFDPIRAKMAGCDTGLPPEIADLFPDRLVNSENGEIPAGWEVSEIGKEVKAVGGSTPSTKEPSYWDQGHHCWATPKDLSKLDSPALLDTNRKITNAGLLKISSGALPVGTVLLSSRAPIGYLAITEVHTAVNQGFIAMICDQRLPNLYVLRWCDANLGHIRNIAGGSTFAEISKKVFRPIPVLVPPEETLRMYERLSRPLYERLVDNTKECVMLGAIRDALLPKLISGEIRIPDAECAVACVT